MGNTKDQLRDPPDHKKVKIDWSQRPYPAWLCQQSLQAQSPVDEESGKQIDQSGFEKKASQLWHRTSSLVL
jgi:hypothetical protein